MGLSPANHELLSVCLLGLGIVLIMNGYDTSSFISESVMHSVHVRKPDQIDGYAGYYGPTVMYGFYTFSTLLSPFVCYKLGAKWTLFTSSLIITVFIANYFYLCSYTYYAAQALLGIAFALYYSGQGQYMSEHSTRETISRNSVIMSALGNQSMMLGGLILLVINIINPPALQEPTEGAHTYRDFSDGEIVIIFGALFISTIMSNILFAFIPTKQYNSLAMKEPASAVTITNQIGLLWKTLGEKKILCLLPFFIFYGLHISFWLIAFPTSFAFSHHLAHNHYLPAYYSIAVSVGNILIGFFIHHMSKKNVSFGLVPAMFTQCFFGLLVYILSLISTPNLSTMVPTTADALFFNPSTFTVILAGILHGMADCCSSTMRSFICTIVLPKQRLQAYSVGKLFQSLATCVGSFLATSLGINAWVVLLIGSQLISSVGFYCVCRNIRKEEQSYKVSPIKAKLSG